MTGSPSRPRGFDPSPDHHQGPRSGPFAPRVKAVLGPTNTGKTHLAMERLLAHGSGIIGFPLRLLARENYDRMVASKGESKVGLITGEEKIVPPGARWFSCTVEAMPLEPIDRRADGLDGFDRPEFVAVDEIQLCADPDRGHVFTDRLLHARGTVETMFLGAETIRPILARLVPGVEIETRPRLSQLSFIGASKLTKLPPRSAVVAFSAGEVYAIAELIRRRRGGCAVVMGRLSPRTRNAQVQLYQDKEVDYLVATDAIGMGLNMDVNHVGFAGLGKFDGARPRRLTAAEVAQIAGRAGRGMRDGTFGTTGTCPAMPEDVVEAVQSHRFDPLEQLFWRNSALDLSGPDALLDSLLVSPPHRALVGGNEASDLQTLQALVRDPEVRALAQNRAATRLLWEACGIPDFRKIGDDSHTRLCARVFFEVARHGRLPADWLEPMLNGLDRTDGDIDTLMQRLSGVRVAAYVAARRDWLADAASWQERARVIEDKLSDALHERLTARFVDRRAAQLIRSLDDSAGGEGGEARELLSAVTARGEVVVEGHSVGHVSGFALIPDPQAEGPEKRLVLRAARRALREEIPRRVQAAVAAPDSSYALSEDGRSVLWDGAPVGRLRPGPTLIRPAVEVRDSEFLDGTQREELRARMQRFVEAVVADALAPLFAAEKAAADDPELRGVLHKLGEQAGLAPGASRFQVPPPTRAKLKALGVRAGRFALFMPALLRPKPARLRAILLGIRSGTVVPALPGEGRVSIPVPPTGAGAEVASFALLQRLGWVGCGAVMIRLDVAERMAGELGWLTRRQPTALPADLASRLSIKGELLPTVLPALDARIMPAFPLPDGMFGPPAPALLAARGERARRLHRGRGRARPDAAAPGAGTEPQAVAAGVAGHAGPGETTAPDAADAGTRDAGPRGAQHRDAGTGTTAGSRGGGSRDPSRAAEPRRPAPHRPAAGPRTPRPGPARPPAPPRPSYNPDSPFAVLAALKLKR